MKQTLIILFFAGFLDLIPVASYSQNKAEVLSIDFYGDTVDVSVQLSVIPQVYPLLSDSSIKSFYSLLNSDNYQSIVNALLQYKEQHRLDDWLFYQLIRNTAELISPKAANYQQYTLLKWFLLSKSGYGTVLSIRNEKLLFYVQSDELIFNIPYLLRDGKQYVCLNYHDYGSIDFAREKFTKVDFFIPEAQNSFSYKVTKLPDFAQQNYSVKYLQFDYYKDAYHFEVLVNKQVQKIFTNYPVVDYESYFNIPLSKTTHNSVIPLLRKSTENMSQKDGVDFLMHFTRYAFLFKTDTENFGSEKRLSPEQTLLNEYSDCEDRSALFFYLVKEIYNLPMIVLAYPEHVTIAVKFSKALNNPIVYNGDNYWVCEPTPQKKDLRIGQLLPALRKASYEVVYAYNPNK